MPIEIKVCGLRDEDNILSLLELEPDHLGFILVEGSKRFVDERKLRTLLKNREISNRAVLVLRDIPFDDLKLLPLDEVRGVQLHGEESSDYISKIREEFPQLKIFKTIGISSRESFKKCDQFQDQVDYFLFDTKIISSEGEISGGTGKTFDWDYLSAYSLETPYLLSGGLGPENLDRVLELAKNDTRLIGVDLNSRFEVAPGLKDVDSLRISFNLLRG